ncbi:hypothetical protein BJ742DRAFT_789891 [Cladochytrium replicatum]|nr:hypothetical protein BJ742DRAFT_789891 [Cladochytrium replicatum]
MELKNSYLEEAETQIRELETTMGDQEAELTQLRIFEAGSDFSATLANLRDNLADAERRNEKLAADLVRAESSVAKEKLKAQDTSTVARNEKTRARNAEDQVSRLKLELMDLHAQISAQKDRLQTKTLDEDQIRVHLKEKNLEIDRYLGEIQTLSEENARLSEEMEDMAQELEATVSELERNSNEIMEAQRLIKSNDDEMANLIHERDLFKAKVHDLSQRIDSQGSKEDKLFGEMQEEVDDYRRVMAESESSILVRDNEIERLKIEIIRLKEELESSNSNSLRREIIDKDDTIRQLKLKLEESYRDFEILSLDYDKIEDLIAIAIGGEQSKKTIDDLAAAIRLQMDSAQKNRKKTEHYKKKHCEDVARIIGVEKQLIEKETELVEAKERLESFVNGKSGLREALLEIKQLKLTKSIREKETVQLTEKMNDFQLQLEDILEENAELRRRLGISDDTKIDVTNMRIQKSLELEQTKALVSALQAEVQVLEEERIQLKRKLRHHAIDRGTRAVELGLTNGELLAVEEYAERIKGKQNIANISTANILHLEQNATSNAQLDNLAVELERAHLNTEEAQEKSTRLEKRLKKAQNSIKSLEAVIKELSSSLVSIEKSHSSLDDDSETLCQFSAVKELLAAFQQRDQKEMQRGLEGNSNLREDLIHINKCLRENIHNLESQNGRVASELQEAQSKLVELAAERENLAERALRAERLISSRRVLQLQDNLSISTLPDYSSVVEQLIQCLLEIKEKSEQLYNSEGLLSVFQDSYRKIISKQKKLFDSFHACQANQKLKIQVLEAKLSEANIQLQASKEHTDQLTRMLKELDRRDELQQSFIESQRNVVVLRVNEVILKRRYLATVETENNLRRENLRLERELLSLKCSTNKELLDLELRSLHSSSEMKAALHRLNGSVPIADYSLLQNQLSVAYIRVSALLRRESELTDKLRSRDGEQRESEALQRQVRELTLTQVELQLKSEKLEVLLDQMQRYEFPAVSTDLVAALRRNAQLESVIEVEKKRAEMAEKKSHNFSVMEEQLQNRLSSLEKMYLEINEQNLKLIESESSVRELYKDGATSEENMANLMKIEELKGKLKSLEFSVHQYQEISEIAATQASDLTHYQKQDEKEKEILRAMILELQMQSDEKLIIGKLHHHILALQMSEATAVRKTEALQGKLLKLEAIKSKFETSVDEGEQRLHQLRLEHSVRVSSLLKEFSGIRLKVSGAVSRDQYERTCELARKSDLARTSMQAELTATQEALAATEEKLRKIEIANQAESELITVVQDSGRMGEKLMEMQSKLSDLKLENFKAQRDNQRMQICLNKASAENQDTAKTISQLEIDLAKVQDEYEQATTNWERRQCELELKIELLEEEREKIFLAATSAEIRKILPDRSLPMGEQLEMSMRMLIERTKLVVAQDLKISTLQSKIDELNRQLQSRDHIGLQRELEINDLRIAHGQDRDAMEQEQEKQRQESIRKRETETIRAAQETINSLQRQLDQKSGTISKYQNMVQELRDEQKKREEEHQRELHRLTDALNAKNDLMIEGVKRPPDAPQSSRQDSEKQIDPSIFSNFEKILAIKEEEICALKSELTTKTKQAEQSSNNLQDQVEKLQRKLLDLSSMLEDKSEVAVKLERSYNDARRALAEAPPAEVLNDVERLREEIERRKKNESTLKRAINELKSEFLKQSEDNNRNDDMKPSSAAKVAELEQKLENSFNQIESFRRQSVQAEKKLARAIHELGQKDNHLSLQSNEIIKLNRTIREKENIISLIRREKSLLSDEISKLKERLKASETSEKHSRKPSGAHAGDSAAVELWGAEKTWKIRVENLKAKILEKTKNVDVLSRQLSSARDSLERCERDRLRLKQRVTSLTAVLDPSKIAPKLKSADEVGSSASKNGPSISPDEAEFEEVARKREDAERLGQLHEHIFSLEAEVTKWKKSSLVDQHIRINAVTSENAVLKETVESLRELNAQMRKIESSPQREGLKGFPSEPAAVLESRIRDLLDKNEALETARVKSEGELLSVKFEREMSIESCERLERRLQELTERLNIMKQSESERLASGNTTLLPGLTIPIPLDKLPAGLRTGTLNDKSPQDLVQVIEYLSRTNEKLKTENSTLRNSSTSNTKYMELVKEVKILKREKEEQLSIIKAKSVTDQHLRKVESENVKIRKQLRKQITVSQAQAQEIEQLKIDKETLMTDITALRRCVANIDGVGDEGSPTSSRVEQLQRELSRAQEQISEMVNLRNGFIEVCYHEAFLLLASYARRS